MSKKRTLAYLALLINTILWGAALPLVKLALPYTTPSRWLFYRYLITAPLSLPLLLYGLTKYKLNLSQWLKIICLEILGVVILLGILYTGLNQTSALDASIIAAMSPIFIVIAGIIFLGEKESGREWTGLGLAFGGTLIITIEPIFNGGYFINGSSLFGNSLIIVHNLIWTIYLVLAKIWYKKIPKLLITSVSFWVGLAGFWLLSGYTSTGPILADLINPTVFWVAAYMAIPGSLIAATLYLYGQNLIEVSEATLFGYLQPLISIPLSIWLLQDRLKPVTIIGLILIIIGVYIAEWRRKRY